MGDSLLDAISDELSGKKKVIPINPPAPLKTDVAPGTSGPVMSEVAPGTGMSSAGPVAPMAGPIAKPNVSSGPPPLNVPAVGANIKDDQDKLDALRSQGSGVDQYRKMHPIAGGILKGLSIVGGTLLPGLAANIPGTDIHHQVLENRAEQNLASDTAASEKQAQAAEANARAEALANPKPDNPEQQFMDEYQKLHPGSSIGDAIQAYNDINSKVTPKAPEIRETENGFVTIDPVTREVTPLLINGQPFKGAKAAPVGSEFDQYYKSWLKDNNQQDTAVNRLKAHNEWEIKPIQPGAANDKASARSDKSYQYNSGVLDKVGSPIEQAVQRMGRLRDTLAQGSPQADALIAPELLTVMAGGAGSGLRMNEAEISRIVGGRSKWEDLKAAANKWSLNPKEANSITPEQRQEIHALVEHVNQKLIAKQKLLDDARNQLLDTDDPKEHRRIVNEARQSMTKIDESGVSDKIKVQIPGHPPGEIPASAKDKFMKDHPDAKVIQ